MTTPSMHVLVVDDHKPNVRMLTDVLGEYYRVTTADSGAQALTRMADSVAQQAVPDLVLLDMDMARVSGWQVLAAWRSDPETADVTVLFLVSKLDAELERRALSAGVAGFVLKPFVESVLKAKVAHQLQLTRQHLYWSQHLRDRTSQLTQALQASRQQHQQQLQAFAGMASVLRSPINAIIGVSHLLELEKPTASQADKLGQVQQTAHQLLRVVNDLLDLSDLEVGSLPLQYVPIHPHDLLQDVHRILQPEARRKGLVFKTVLPSDAQSIRLMGDPLRIAQILIHLCDNAIRHTDSGQVALGLKWVVQEGSVWEVRWYVRDTGCGMPEDDLQDLLLARVMRSGRSPDRAGLGLTLSNRLATLMQGQLGAHTSAQDGSSFWLDLVMSMVEPQSQSEDTATTRRPPDHHVTLTYTEVMSGQTLLLVEDDPAIQACLLELLTPYQLKIEVADNGAQALNQVRMCPFDLVLMDVQLPYMDGLEATRAMHQLPGRSGLPVVGLASHLFSEDRLRCKAAGMSDFVMKPVSRESLHRVLAAYLPSRQATPSTTTDTASPSPRPRQARPV